MIGIYLTFSHELPLFNEKRMGNYWEYNLRSSKLRCFLSIQELKIYCLFLYNSIQVMKTIILLSVLLSIVSAKFLELQYQVSRLFLFYSRGRITLLWVYISIVYEENDNNTDNELEVQFNCNSTTLRIFQ